MNVAEQTGAVLQNTSMTSTSRSGWISPAPSSMPTAASWRTRRMCRCIWARWARACAPCWRRAARTLKPGDVVALNNPFNGGTHLPDVTVITPVFDDGRPRHPVLRRQPRPSRRYRRHHAGIDAAIPARWRRKASSSTISCWSMAAHFRETRVPRAARRREISGAQPRRERRRHQGAGRRQREGRAGTAARRRAIRLADGRAPICAMSWTTPRRWSAA